MVAEGAVSGDVADMEVRETNMVPGKASGHGARICLAAAPEVPGVAEPETVLSTIEAAPTGAR